MNNFTPTQYNDNDIVAQHSFDVKQSHNIILAAEVLKTVSSGKLPQQYSTKDTDPLYAQAQYLNDMLETRSLTHRGHDNMHSVTCRAIIIDDTVGIEITYHDTTQHAKASIMTFDKETRHVNLVEYATR